MFQKIKDWFRQERFTRSLSRLHFFQQLNDPRELPRPDRSAPYKFGTTTQGSEDINGVNRTEQELCSCKNCLEILDCFSECAICLEPLQGVPICSCMFCGNYTCWTCSDKVIHCPFCRISFQQENRIRNFGLERVLSNLNLPCRHARWGCQMQLNQKERATHELSCTFAPAGCPLVKLCGWHGDISDIARHLKDIHDMTLIASNGINVEISDFRVKLLNTITAPRLYTVSLTCHGNIYICKLKMQNLKLRLVFFQVTGELSPKNQKFGAHLEIATPSRILTGIVEISSKHRNNKEIIIPAQTLFSSANQGDDFVKINITIKPMQ